MGAQGGSKRMTVTELGVVLGVIAKLTLKVPSAFKVKPYDVAPVNVNPGLLKVTPVTFPKLNPVTTTVEVTPERMDAGATLVKMG